MLETDVLMWTHHFTSSRNWVGCPGIWTLSNMLSGLWFNTKK